MPTTSPVEISTLVQDAMRAAMTEYVGELADDLQETLSTPYPPSSKPGESPHRRTGKLRNSVRDNVTPQGSHTIGEVSAETPYAAFLEDGTAAMKGPRPYIAPLATRAESEAPTRLIDLFVTHF